MNKTSNSEFWKGTLIKPKINWIFSVGEKSMFHNKQPTNHLNQNSTELFFFWPQNRWIDFVIVLNISDLGNVIYLHWIPDVSYYIQLIGRFNTRFITARSSIFFVLIKIDHWLQNYVWGTFCPKSRFPPRSQAEIIDKRIN